MRSNDVNGWADYISELKVTVYKRTLLIACVVIILAWALSAQNEALTGITKFTFPFFTIFSIVSFFLFDKYRGQYLTQFEYSGFALLFVYFLLEFVQGVIRGIGQPELDFQKILLWIAVLYTFAFLVFPLRKALHWSGVFIFCLFLASVSYVIAKWGSAKIGDDIQILGEICGSGLAYISLLYAISKLKDKYKESEIRSELLNSRANVDGLTGAFSRGKIEELLEFYITQVNIHHHQSLSIMLFDLDKLKIINDTFGHDIGDYALKQTTKLVMDNLRENDSIGRIGGDEFLLICPNTGKKQIQLLAERLEKKIEIATFKTINPTISIGTATYQENDTLQKLIKRADTRMYIHKRAKSSEKQTRTIKSL